MCVVLALAMQTPGQRPPQMPTLPLTQIDERAASADLDHGTFTLTFTQAVPIRDVLAQLVRGTSLGVVADPAITGTFAGELKNVTVRQALASILPPLGLDFSVAGTIVRVFRREPETRIFDVNYIAAERTGSNTIGATPTAGIGTGASVSTTIRNDLFAELSRGVQTLLSEHATFNVDRKAGLLQVTDFPERLERVASYLDVVQTRVQRQVQIDARIVEVALRDDRASSFDWSALSGRVATLAQVMTALDAQGTVTVRANPRLLTVNNEPAVVRSGVMTISVTPQIGEDAIMLAVSPIVSGPAEAQADMLARIGDGETLIIRGFTHDRDAPEGKKAARRRIETVILLTPHVVAGGESR